MTKKNILKICLVMYIFAVFCLTLLPYGSSVKYDSNYNLTLFRSICNYLRHMSNFGLINREAFTYLPFHVIKFAYSVFSVSFKNILGNILLFIPFGLIVPFFIQHKKFITVTFYGTLLSITIEVLQFQFLSSRRADVDDIILNAFGVILGYLMYRIYNRKAKLN